MHQYNIKADVTANSLFAIYCFLDLVCILNIVPHYTRNYLFMVKMGVSVISALERPNQSIIILRMGATGSIFPHSLRARFL